MNALTRWDPFKKMEDMQSRMARMFGLAPARVTNGDKESMSVAQWAPLVDITEGDKEWVVKADLPEVKEEDVKVTVENGVLTITGERKFEKEEKDKKHHLIERSYGNFLRSFTLPEDADGSKLNAEFKDGVLKPLGEEGLQQHLYIDRLVMKYTDFESMADLLNAKGVYRPAVYLRSGERWMRHEVNFIADEYNRRQEARGDPRRAFRLGANANSAPPDP